MLIAVTGGIGAGKSVVCRVLRTMGYPVFDCDSEAKALMDADCDIKRRIAIEIDESAVCCGNIDRRRLAEIVFADVAKLEILNSIVHGAVRQRIAEWEQTLAGRLLFVETAILFQSGLNRLVDEEWRVEAPRDMRVERVMMRNAMTREQVEARIEAQEYVVSPDEPKLHLVRLFNDERHSLLSQILVRISNLSPAESVMP